jgi:hypothetical protein
MLVAYEAMDINNENLHCFFLVFLDSWLQPGNPSTRSSPGGGLLPVAWAQAWLRVAVPHHAQRVAFMLAVVLEALV